MAEKPNILSTVPVMEYMEKAPKINEKEFQKVIDSRRSVRVFDGEPIPEKVVTRCLENALLAPNSSNLQPWEFIWVHSDEKKKEMVKACLGQSAAKTASELFVVVARTGTWRNHAADMLDLLKKGGAETPKLALQYYGKIVPLVYTQGFCGVLGFLKRFLYFFRGLSAPIIREPVTLGHMRLWAVKSTALGAENLMLSLRAYGYDSCPMEGYDSKRIKKILDLPGDASVVMVVAAGKRVKGGIYGPRIRFDSGKFIKKV
ncbi:MAG TPA: nitroreductase family protein [Spirochaetota bacterium]|nr:nitroreductase family protein [Spirochaetota bacterium]